MYTLCVLYSVPRGDVQVYMDYYTCTHMYYISVCLIVVPPSLPPSLLVLSSFIHEHKNDIPVRDGRCVTLGTDRVPELWVSQKLIHQTDHNEEYNHDSQFTT